MWFVCYHLYVGRGTREDVGNHCSGEIFIIFFAFRYWNWISISNLYFLNDYFFWTLINWSLPPLHILNGTFHKLLPFDSWHLIGSARRQSYCSLETSPILKFNYFITLRSVSVFDVLNGYPLSKGKRKKGRRFSNSFSFDYWRVSSRFGVSQEQIKRGIKRGLIAGSKMYTVLQFPYLAPFMSSYF